MLYCQSCSPVQGDQWQESEAFDSHTPFAGWLSNKRSHATGGSFHDDGSRTDDEDDA